MEIKILIDTSIYIIGASLDETSPMFTVVQNDGIIATKRYLCVELSKQA